MASSISTQISMHTAQVFISLLHGTDFSEVILMKLCRTEFEVSLLWVALQEGILEYDVFLEVGAGIHEGMGNVDAVFNGGVLEEME